MDYIEYTRRAAGYYPSFPRAVRARVEKAAVGAGIRQPDTYTGPAADDVRATSKLDRTGAAGLLGGCGGDPAEAGRRRAAAYGPGALP